MENEDDDPVGCPAPRDPVAEFRIAAEESGLILHGDPIDQNLLDFAYRIVERCACVAESFSDHDESAADAIRSELGDH